MAFSTPTLTPPDDELCSIVNFHHTHSVVIVVMIVFSFFVAGELGGGGLTRLPARTEMVGPLLTAPIQ